jgi:hypothetical protein
MAPSLLDRVRAACAEVSARAQHLAIDEARIPSYAASLPLDRARAAQLDARHHYLGRPEDTLAYFLTLDAINFGSGYFPELRKRPNLSGYLTVAASLADRFRARGPFSAQELSGLTPQDCAELFGQSPASGPIGELMGLFASALNQLGSYLLERYGGSFIGLVEAAGSSAERLVQLLAQMPYFADVERYEDLDVPFYKRAQLSAADLSIALDGRGYGFFRDLDRLTIFADNLVPHVLRVDGVLRYEESLARRIKAGELIPAGSAEEVEIRASALQAAELLVEALLRMGERFSARELDYLLWNRGQQPSYKALPRHRTRTVFY